MDKKLQLVTTHYLNKKQADSDDGFDKLIVITKDETGKKYSQVIEEPMFSFYVTKPSVYETDKNKHNYIERDKVMRKTCYYRDLYKTMVESTKDKELLKEYYNIFKTGGSNIYNLLKDLHLDYRFHSSDMNIQDFTIHNILNKYNPDENFVSLTKAFFDIEVDGSKLKGFPKPELALAPINIITLINQENMTSYSLMLEYKHEGYKNTINKLNDIKKRLKDKYKNKINLNGLKFEFEEFSSEIDLIKRFFELINEELRPDFVCAWNISFDLVTIYNRILNLGEDPNEIMCPKDFKYKSASYKLDVKNSDPADKSDVYYILGYTVYFDLMNLYANITKPLGKKESYSLDFIAEEELGEHKDEYEGNIKTLHLDDYETFLFYNIQDVILLFLLEDKTKHLDLLYNISMMTHTRIDKALKKTVCLRNFAAQFYEEAGFVMSNNRSALFEKPESKIKGAFVADPNNMDDIGKEIIPGLKSNKLFDFASDMDFSALYPSITEAFNIAVESMDVKLFISFLNKETNEYEEKTGDFMDDFLSNDPINFCHKYYNVPNCNEMIDIISNYSK